MIENKVSQDEDLEVRSSKTNGSVTNSLEDNSSEAISSKNKAVKNSELGKESLENEDLNIAVTNETDKNDRIKSPSMFSIIGSVLAAMIGIQSDKNRERDFEGGHMGNYIFVGIVMVLIFIFTLISIVDSILENSGQK